ncbi:MAG: ParB/RepB/Spo0J family partition protein [Armatimonadetes bacterium]|nr:ParB/RepB/Spo0J family partition protein [Armatimonadota bacterium]
MEKNKTPEKPASRLGRGLAALIPPSAASPTPPTPPELRAGGAKSSEGIQELPLDAIAANPDQPRTVFDAAAAADLAESVRRHGVLQPVMVRPRGGGGYQLVAGERRFRAATDAGLTHIPAVVRSLTDEETLTVALIENIQREDLNPIEAARAYKHLMDEYGLTQTQLGRQIGKSQSTISNAMRLMNLSAEMQDSICDGRISVEHGKELLGIPNLKKRQEVWEDMITTKMDRDAAREHARMARDLSKAGSARKDANWRDLEEKFKQAFHAQVAISPAKRGGGTLTIKYANQEQLEGLLDRLEGR